MINGIKTHWRQVVSAFLIVVGLLAGGFVGGLLVGFAVCWLLSLWTETP